MIALGDTAAPAASTTKQRSASPSKARPRSAPSATTALLQVDEVRRLERVGLVVRERPVELEVQRHDRQRQRRQHAVAEHGRHGVAAHAVAGVDDDLERPDAGQVDEPAQVLGVGRQQVDAARRRRRRRRRAARRRGTARPGRGSRPARSPGRWPRRPARHSLMPLYRAGLWLAVNIAPGRPRWPDAKYSMSVEASPASTTDAPRCIAPSAKARARPGPVSRMSWAVTIRSAPVTSTNAAPIARAIGSSSWSGTTPRTS